MKSTYQNLITSIHSFKIAIQYTQWKILIFSLFCVLLSCNNPKKSNDQSSSQGKTTDIENNSTLELSPDSIDTQHSDENAKGTSGNLPKDSSNTSTQPNFNSYTVKVDNKKYANLDFKSNPDASNFRTQLTKAYQDPKANFAGHFTFASWGCGSSCQSSMLIDRKTGKIYEGPIASSGFEFKPDSRMLVVNPKVEGDNEVTCIDCQTKVYIWEETSNKLEEYH